VLVKVNKMLTIGTISNNVAIVPKLDISLVDLLKTIVIMHRVRIVADIFSDTYDVYAPEC